MLKPGDIFVTRNKDEAENQSPGYWNHVALYTNQGVIEGQSPPWNSVICSELNEFKNRYYKWNVYRFNEDVGAKAAAKALSLVGKPYQWMNSFWYNISLGWHFGRKFNCVSAIRAAYHQVLEYDPHWTIPDDITKDKRLTLVMTKEEGIEINYDN
jgi:uncharacterized protein YycO